MYLRIFPKAFNHQAQSSRCFARSRRTNQQEIILGSQCFPRNTIKVGRCIYYLFIISRAKLRQALKEKQVTPFFRGTCKSRQSHIHASESGIHDVVFQRIETIGRNHRRILLRSTQPYFHTMFVNGFNITFKNHLVGNLIGIVVSLIQNNSISLPEIRQRHLCFNFTAVGFGNSQSKRCFVFIGSVVLNNG